MWTDDAIQLGATVSKESLLDYFERELKYLRRRGTDFAKRYPSIAGKLELQSTGSADPHVERLIEAFAFLTARIHRRLDDDFPEITDALLSVIQPQFLAPIPSLAIAQFDIDPSQGKATEALRISSGSVLRSPPVRGEPCLFRSCYDVDIWPIKVLHAELVSVQPDDAPPPSARSLLRIRIGTLDQSPLAELGLDKLRFYLHGSEQTPYFLYDFLTQNASEIHVAYSVDGGGLRTHRLPNEVIQPVGFGPSEGLLNHSPLTPLAYRLLLEYFAFPQKYLFVDIGQLSQYVRLCMGSDLEIRIFSQHLPTTSARDIDSSTLQLGCTPVSNYFVRHAEPIRVTHRKTEYRVVPNKFAPDAVEVCDILSVQGMPTSDHEQVTYRPFYSLSHSSSETERGFDSYYYPSRQESHRAKQDGTPTEVYLTFVNMNGDPSVIQDDILRVTSLCCNHNMPSQLPFGESRSDFQLDGPLAANVRCLTKPTPSLRIPGRRGLYWRLISQISLNQVTLTSPEYALTTIQELLRLFDFVDSNVTRQHIHGILRLTGRPVAARVSGNGGSGMARGVELTMQLDPTKFVGGSSALFSSVLEHFFGLLAPMNSFTRLCVELRGHEGFAYSWPARSGERSLI